MGFDVTDREGRRHAYPNQGAILRMNPDGTDFEVFAAGHGDWTSGVPATGRWTPSGPATQVYRFTYGIADDPAAEGQTAGATFTWEARSV